MSKQDSKFTARQFKRMEAKAPDMYELLDMLKQWENTGKRGWVLVEAEIVKEAINLLSEINGGE